MQISSQVYSDHIHIVYKYAHKIAKKYGVLFDDLLGPATELMIKAYKKFDESKGIRFSTYLWNWLNPLHDIAKSLFKTYESTVSLGLASVSSGEGVSTTSFVPSVNVTYTPYFVISFLLIIILHFYIF